MERQCLDKCSEATAGLFTKHTRTLSIQTREIKTMKKGVSKLYKITLAFKNGQSVDRFIGGASWFWLKYSVTELDRRPRKVTRLDRECLPCGQILGRNRRMYKRGGRRWRKEGCNGMREE